LLLPEICISSLTPVTREKEDWQGTPSIYRQSTEHDAGGPPHAASSHEHGMLTAH
jgi:hypothetical protein